MGSTFHSPLPPFSFPLQNHSNSQFFFCESCSVYSIRCQPLCLMPTPSFENREHPCRPSRATLSSASNNLVREQPLGYQPPFISWVQVYIFLVLDQYTPPYNHVLDFYFILNLNTSYSGYFVLIFTFLDLVCVFCGNFHIGQWPIYNTYFCLKSLIFF